MRRLGVVVVLVLMGAGLIGVWRSVAEQEARRKGGVETSRVRDWARTEGGAGISVLPKRVPAADSRELREVEGLPGFHEFAMRCSSCHVLPDPAAYPGERWPGKVEEMREHIQRSGMLPPPESDLELARQFLRAAADSLR
jgi:hypothetical protein